MWRNREWRCLSILLFVFCFLSVVISAAFDMRLALILGCNYLFLSIVFYVFTRSRYQHIKELSFYLQEIYQGKESFDIREYREGELSILKSDIYKMTRMLLQQTETLLQDKTFLVTSLSDISHQLKTPLTSMIMMSDLLKDEQLPILKRREFLHQMNAQLERIEWMVSSLLKLSKIDAEAILFKQERVLVLDILEKSIAPLLIPMELRQIQVQISCDATLTIVGDANWAREALLNVIKNCMEHMEPQGHLDILVQDNPLHTRIQIQDDGCGIDEDDLPHIFERFYRGKNASKDSVGIGLAMSKAILLKQNAKIEVESVLAKGTCFTIYFYKE